MIKLRNLLLQEEVRFNVEGDFERIKNFILNSRNKQSWKDRLVGMLERGFSKEGITIKQINALRDTVSDLRYKKATGGKDPNQTELFEDYIDDIDRIGDILAEHHFKVLDIIKEEFQMYKESIASDRYLSYIEPGYRRLSDIQDVFGDMEGWLYLPEDHYNELNTIIDNTDKPGEVLSRINELFAEYTRDVEELVNSFN